MAKKKKVKEPSLFPETERIAALLSKEDVQDIVILVVPSHNKQKQKLPEALTGEWASNALKLMADLYQGATAFRAEHGIYKTTEGEYLWDEPLVIESFAPIEAIEDPARLEELVRFAKRMGKTLDQAAIMLAFGTVMFYVEDYSGV